MIDFFMLSLAFIATTSLVWWVNFASLFLVSRFNSLFGSRDDILTGVVFWGLPSRMKFSLPSISVASLERCLISFWSVAVFLTRSVCCFLSSLIKRFWTLLIFWMRFWIIVFFFSITNCSRFCVQEFFPSHSVEAVVLISLSGDPWITRNGLGVPNGI